MSDRNVAFVRAHARFTMLQVPLTPQYFHVPLYYRTNIRTLPSEVCHCRLRTDINLPIGPCSQHMVCFPPKLEPFRRETMTLYDFRYPSPFRRVHGRILLGNLANTCSCDHPVTVNFNGWDPIVVWPEGRWTRASNHEHRSRVTI